MDRLKKRIRKLIQMTTVKDNDFYRRLGVKMGEDVHILNSNLDEGYPYLISIGDHVTITKADILVHDASTLRFLDGYVKIGKVTIGNNVFIGHGCVVLPGTDIGNNVICGANSVVRGIIPDNVVIAGNPWKVICTYDEYVNKHKSNMNESNTFSTYFAEKQDFEKEKILKELDRVRIGYSK